MRFTLHTMFCERFRLRRNFRFPGTPILRDKIYLKRFPQEVHTSCARPVPNATIVFVFLGTAGGCTHIEHTVELSTRQPCMDGHTTNNQFQEHVLTKTLSTLRAGGPARLYVSVHTDEQLLDALRTLKENKTRFLVIGGGSNILFPDTGYDGCVVHMKTQNIRTISDDGVVVRVSADAGVPWDVFVEGMVAAGFWGIENLSGIPGTVGATPVQNVGAYGVEVRETIESVECIDTTTLTEKYFSNEECLFAYRDSVFKQNPGRYVITRVTFLFSRVQNQKLGYADVADFFKDNKEPTLEEIRSAILLIRARKFPDMSVVGTAGSFFKNPIVQKENAERLIARYPTISTYPTPDGKIKLSLAWILDKALQLKGFRKGNVGLCEHQPLVLVAYEGATAKEIDVFAQYIADTVRDTTGISIEREVVTIT